MTFEHFEKSFEQKAVKAGYSADNLKRCLEYAKPLIERNLPVIFNTANLAALVGYDRAYLKKAVLYTKHYYRTFTIAKSNGKRRELSEPLPSLKEIQHWILTNILYSIPVSRFAKAYVLNRSLIENVRYHKKKDVVVCLDITNFFTSIRRSSIEILFKEMGYSSNISNLLSKLCCLDECLPQGAPTSPYLSNLFMKDFDSDVSEFCKIHLIRYTRYADDITLSGTIDTSAAIAFVKDRLGKKNLFLNEAKVKIMTSGSRQIVTGLVVNEKIQVPKVKRDKIRQEVYYIKKFGLIDHLKTVGENRSNYLRHLIGKVNFVLHINSKDKEMQGNLVYLRGLLR